MAHPYTRPEDEAVDTTLFTPGVMVLLALVVVLAMAAVFIALQRDTGAGDTVEEAPLATVVGEDVEEDEPAREPAEQRPSGSVAPQ